MEEKEEQKGNYQALEVKFAQMLSTQKEEQHKEMKQLKDEFAKMLSIQSDQHQQQMEQLEFKNRKLEEKLMGNAEVQPTKNEALDEKMEQLQLHDEFSKKLAEQQKQMVAQFQAQFHSLEQKLKEAEQRAQMGKNQFAEDIQQKMEKFREEMDKNGQQVICSIQQKLDYMWSQLMAKSKILENPKGIVWDGSKTTNASISKCGLKATNNSYKYSFAIATKGYAISAEHCRKENFQFAGTIVYYCEVTMSSIHWYSVGFTDGSKIAGCVGDSKNSYGIVVHDAKIDSLWLSGKKHTLEYPTGSIAGGDVFGCGLLMNSKNELAVFFTLNGVLLGKQTPINPTVDRLYPTVFTLYSVEANFGDNLIAKPFKFDTGKCPGLVFE